MNTQKETPLLTIVGQGDTTQQVGTIQTCIPFGKRAEGIPYPIFPCRRYADGKAKSKSPLTYRGHLDATTDADTIAAWSKQWPDALIGVPTGPISGIDVVDIDVEVDKSTGKLVKDGHSALKAAGVTLPATRVHKTARGGEHHLFKSSGLKNSAGKVAKDVDVRGDGGYIIWWPAEGLEVTDMPMVDAPELTKPSFALGAVTAIPDGRRNDTLFKLASKLQGQGLSNEAVWGAVWGENISKCKPPLEENEVRVIVSQALKFEKGDVTFDTAPLQPIPNALLSVMPFNCDTMLPDILREWVKDKAHRMQCPPDYIAVAAIISISSLIARKVCLQVKRKDTDWKVTPNLWGATIGNSGMMKSPSIGAALAALYSLEAKEKAEIAELIEGQQRNALMNKLKAESLRERIKAHFKKSMNLEAYELENELKACEPKEFKEKRYIVNNTTVEKLSSVLNENPQGLLMIQDEIIGWIQKMESAGYEGSRSFYLSCADGDTTERNDRVGSGSKSPLLCLSLVGGIQPGILYELIKGAVEGGGGADGLLQRFGMMVWPDDGGFEYVDEAPVEFLNGMVQGIFDKFDNIPLEDKQRIVKFSPKAQSVFVNWYSRLRVKIKNDDVGEAIRGHYSKYSKTIPSLALIFELIKGGDVVDVESMNMALEWEKYLSSHAERVYDFGMNNFETSAKLIIRKIKEGKLGNGVSFKVRELKRKCWSGLTRDDQVEGALALLEENNYVKVDEIYTNGRPTVVCYINPACLLVAVEEP